MVQSLAAATKARIAALLKERYPDRYRLFSLKSQSWSTGGAVDLTWIDGPSTRAVDALLAPLREKTIILLGLNRHYSEGFIQKVATEYCSVAGCELPCLMYPYADGSAWLDTDYSRDLPYRTIFDQMAALDAEDLPALAYRLHLINEVQTPVRAWVVRRMDYSYGTYPDYAIVREKSYTRPERKLFRVRRRLSERWVEVVELTSLGHLSHLKDLDEYMRFLARMGRV